MSSANYEARAFGVRAGMFISEAKRLCPDIIVMPYMFEKYEAISERVSAVQILFSVFSHTNMQ